MNKKVFFILALLCAVVQGAWAKSVTFRVCSWDDVNKQVVTTTETHDATVLEGEHPDDWVGLTNGYYLVNSDTEYEVLNIMGDVHLILSGNATLACKHVKLEGENKLHIHNIADDNTGTLEVTNSRILRRAVGGNKTKSCVHHYLYGEYDEAAALGGGGNQNMGSLYVHGGAVSVLQSGGGAAIGGGKNASIGGEVVVYAGTVEAHSKSSHMSGAAIGGGKGYSQGGPVTIYGGKVKAFVNETLNDANNGAGIGGGANGGGHGGTVTIWGGEVLAIGGKEATGIGGGYKGAGGDVHIYGGTVEARGGEKSSAIGAYDDYKLGTVGFSDNMRVKGGTAARGAEDYELTPTKRPANTRHPPRLWVATIRNRSIIPSTTMRLTPSIAATATPHGRRITRQRTASVAGQATNISSRSMCQVLTRMNTMRAPQPPLELARHSCCPHVASFLRATRSPAGR